MANIFEQAKQAMAMRREAKRIQAEIEKITYTYANGGITCTAKGDFTITSLKFAPDAFAEVIAGKPERFETMLSSVINGALKGVRKQTQEAMQKLMKANGGGALGGLLG